jgi:hypothetical protein
MKYIKSKSNYTLENWPDGTYDGYIKGYDVYSDEVDSGFKTLTGLRNMKPIKCKIYIKEGGATVFYKDGVLFSDEETKDSWINEFGKLKNDPRFKYEN